MTDSAWWRRGLAVARRRFPTAYWRLRNLAALLAWHWYRWHPGRAAADAYDDAFWGFHSVGDWDGFAGVVARLLPSASIVDIGCGQGLALEAFRRNNPRLIVRGYDDSPAALDRARARHLPVDRLDVCSLSDQQAQEKAAEIGSFDLTLCLEVAEHLPPWHGRRLITVLSGARRLIFSAAHPGQGGRLHVNEQPAAYWMKRLARRGLVLSPVDDEFRAAVARLSLPSWYAQNVHVFERAGPLP
jgi:SAM-dependent methyltransferase